MCRYKDWCTDRKIQEVACTLYFWRIVKNNYQKFEYLTFKNEILEGIVDIMLQRKDYVKTTQLLQHMLFQQQ